MRRRYGANENRSIRDVGAALLTVGVLCAPLEVGFAQAEQSPAAESNRSSFLEEITVQARRRDENVQDVPMTINTFSPDALASQDIRLPSDLERQIPGYLSCCTRGTTMFVWIRGIPGVVGYFAEVPAPFDGGGLMWDLENVQALKGPQGTLFGLSTNGGAILHVPRKPQPDPGGYLTVSMGERDYYSVEGVANLPASDTVQFRLGGVYLENGGFIKETSRNVKLGDENYWNLRASMLFKPVDRFENYFIANYSKSRQRHQSYVLTAVNPDSPARSIFGPALDDYLLQQQQAGVYNHVGLSADIRPAVTDKLVIADVATIELTDTFTVKNIAGYNRSRTLRASPQDTDGTAFPIWDSNVDPTTPTALPTVTEYSEELQLLGNWDQFDLVTGIFLHRTKSDQDEPSYQFTLGSKSGAINSTASRAQAAYAQGTYNFEGSLEGLSLTLGARHTRDKREASQLRVNAAQAPISYFSDSATFSATTYTVSASYKLTSNTMIFLTNAKGFSSGGFNLTSPTPEARKYEPESLNNFELGIRSEGRFGSVETRTNVTLFYGLYDDIQAVQQRLFTLPNGEPIVASPIQNAAEGELRGIEAEIGLAAGGWQLSGSGVYMKTEFTSFPGAVDTNGRLLNLKGRQFLFVPEWKYDVRLAYELPFPISIGTLTASATYSARGGYKYIQTDTPEPIDFAPPQDNLNMSVDWRDVLGRPDWNVQLFATNVLEQEFANGQVAAYRNFGVYPRVVAPPRQVGIRLRKEF